MVMEDSNHEYDSVSGNLQAYHRFVTAGSYLIVQDTRTGRDRADLQLTNGASRAVSEFLRKHGWGAQSAPQLRRAGRLSAGHAQPFVRDRAPEYLLFSQHTGGFLRRLLPSEKPHPWWDEIR